MYIPYPVEVVTLNTSTKTWTVFKNSTFETLAYLHNCSELSVNLYKK